MTSVSCKQSIKTPHAAFSIIALLSFFFVAHGFATGPEKAAADDQAPINSYRIIRTSPYEFVSALRAAPQKQNGDSKGGTRLAKFLRIKNKSVRNKTIEFEVIPEIPLLPEYFEKMTELKVTLNEIRAGNQSYEFDTSIEAKGKKTISSRIWITPHPQGSLLKLAFIDSDYSKWTLKAFTQAAKTMGFTADTPAQAEILDTKDLEKAKTKTQTESLKNHK